MTRKQGRFSWVRAKQALHENCRKLRKKQKTFVKSPLLLYNPSGFDDVITRHIGSCCEGFYFYTKDFRRALQYLFVSFFNI